MPTTRRKNTWIRKPRDMRTSTVIVRLSSGTMWKNRASLQGTTATLRRKAERLHTLSKLVLILQISARKMRTPRPRPTWTQTDRHTPMLPASVRPSFGIRKSVAARRRRMTVRKIMKVPSGLTRFRPASTLQSSARQTRTARLTPILKRTARQQSMKMRLALLSAGGIPSSKRNSPRTIVIPTRRKVLPLRWLSMPIHSHQTLVSKTRIKRLSIISTPTVRTTQTNMVIARKSSGTTPSRGVRLPKMTAMSMSAVPKLNMLFRLANIPLPLARPMLTRRQRTMLKPTVRNTPTSTANASAHYGIRYGKNARRRGTTAPKAILAKNGLTSSKLANTLRPSVRRMPTRRPRMISIRIAKLWSMAMPDVSPIRTTSLVRRHSNSRRTIARNTIRVPRLLFLRRIRKSPAVRSSPALRRQTRTPRLSLRSRNRARPLLTNVAIARKTRNGKANTARNSPRTTAPTTVWVARLSLPKKTLPAILSSPTFHRKRLPALRERPYKPKDRKLPIRKVTVLGLVLIPRNSRKTTVRQAASLRA